MKKINTRMLVTLGLLVALHIILSRFLSFNAWNMKIGLTFIATFAGAYLYGPWAGAIVGSLGDFLGATLFPIGAYFPGFTLNCALTGVVFGLLLYKKQSPVRVVLAAVIDQVGISMWITPLWISILYGSPYWPLVLTRLPQTGVMLVAEIVVLLVMIKVMDRVKRAESIEEKEPPKDERRELRKSRIAARDALTPTERAEKSKAICEKILASEEYRNADKILIYSAIRGEVSLSALENDPSTKEKTIAYPLVLGARQMIALVPNGEEGMVEGFHGIKEPDRNNSTEIAPEDFDLIICPCTAFDEQLGRMGMGAGYYDTYLEACKNAKVVAVAFECQKADSVMRQEWDKPMDKVFTEDRIYG